jgi:[ribosomal protein S5]-alanine N-acetyltransferase
MADELRTDRLLLRRAVATDVDAMHRIMSNPIAMRYWSTPPHVDVG